MGCTYRSFKYMKAFKLFSVTADIRNLHTCPTTKQLLTNLDTQIAKYIQ